MNISHACNLFVAELATPFFATSVAVFGAIVCGFKIRLPSMSIKYSRDKDGNSLFRRSGVMFGDYLIVSFVDYSVVSFFAFR